MKIIAVDWGKDTRKRSAYISDLHARLISRLPFDGRLSHLLEHAVTLQGPVLIGIDAAIGFPAADWKILANRNTSQEPGFAKFLLGSAVPADFFEPVSRPSDWSPERPFISPPRGRWSLKAFEAASRGGFYRRIDRRLKAQPIFVTSGIPGSVGSGTRALWQELREFHERFSFSIWPFHGAINELLRNGHPVIAEIYPKACYGIALSEKLPAPLLSIAKTKQPVRQHALEMLLETAWIIREQIVIDDLHAAIENEDDFDALVSAAALTRLFLENASLDDKDETNEIESKIEGSVLGATSIDCTTGSLRYTQTGHRTERTKGRQSNEAQPCRCPIPGCVYVYRKGRSGWDAHVASVSRHPDWHPVVRDAARRKKLFRLEFPEWFARASRNPGKS